MKRRILLATLALSLTFGSSSGYACYLSCPAVPPASSNTSVQQPWGAVVWTVVLSLTGFSGLVI